MLLRNNLLWVEARPVGANPAQHLRLLVSSWANLPKDMDSNGWDVSFRDNIALGIWGTGPSEPRWPLCSYSEGGAWQRRRGEKVECKVTVRHGWFRWESSQGSRLVITQFGSLELLGELV